MRTSFFAALISVILMPCSTFAQSAQVPEPPPAQREFRAAWVATVSNIDWPSRRGLSTKDQMREIIAILDRAAEIKLNAIILQVRTSCDALYESELEPWSEYLTGKQGQRPKPYYDPLEYWVTEAHKRGIELHAWFNPYRAKVGAGREDRHPTHISKTHPHLAKDYGKFLWLDPGEPEASDHSFNVFMDVVRRYDVDGIHIDDYFYPYPVTGDDKKEIPFPDDASWKRYQDSGGKLSRNDWRRQNVNELIKRIYEGTKAEKRHVQFGISPFGIPRPALAGIEYVRGFDQYEKLYADAVLWLQEGWCDYFVPQLYWATGAPQQPYLGLLNWWVNNNPRDIHMYGGLFTSRIDFSEKSWCPSEILGQIMITRLTPGAGGNVQFSMKALTQNRKGLADQLRNVLHVDHALPPVTAWLDGQAPSRPASIKFTKLDPKQMQNHWPKPAPMPRAPARTEEEHRFFVPLSDATDEEKEARSKRGGLRVTWVPGGDENVRLWAVYSRHGDQWRLKAVPGHLRETIVPDTSAAANAIAVSALDRLGHESPRLTIAVPK